MAAKEAGARVAGHGLVRLPLSVAPVFLEWLGRRLPDRKGRVESRIRDIQSGKLNDTEFWRRMSGTGAMANQIGAIFAVFARKVGLDGRLPAYDFSRYHAPPDTRETR